MTGLLALMLLIEARRPAQVSANGELVPLREQDRGAWEATLIAEGHRLNREEGTDLGVGRRMRLVHDSAREQLGAFYDPLAGEGGRLLDRFDDDHLETLYDFLVEATRLVEEHEGRIRS